MTISKAKKEYNTLLQRFQKANEYFENDKISDSDKEIQLPNFQEILVGLNYYLEKIEIYTNQELLEGFHGPNKFENQKS